MPNDIDDIVEERGANYGHPLDHFACTQELFTRWLERRTLVEPAAVFLKEYALRHGVYMILDKLARAAQNPEHMDNWDDIQGYAKCIIKILKRCREENDATD